LALMLTSVIAGCVSQRFQYDAANRLARATTDNQTIIAGYTYGDSNKHLIAEETGGRLLLAKAEKLRQF
jgi:hypothetical protein